MRGRQINGVAVRALREALGLRNVDLSRRSQVSASHLTQIEQGTKQCSEAAMRRIADGLGVPMEAVTYPVIILAAIPESVTS